MARAGNCEYYQNCNLQGLPLNDLLAALIVVDANGCFHINTVATTGECNTISMALQCGTGESFEDLLRKTVVLDDCGNPALSVFTSTVLQ